MFTQRPRNKDLRCGTCMLILPAGASHANATACVEALRDALDTALTCEACGFDVGSHCPPCAIKKGLTTKATNAASNAGMHIFAKLRERFEKKEETK